MPKPSKNSKPIFNRKRSRKTQVFNNYKLIIIILIVQKLVFLGLHSHNICGVNVTVELKSKVRLNSSLDNLHPTTFVLLHNKFI